MNKDAVLATIIGFTVGLIVTGIVLYGPNLAKGIKMPVFPTISFKLPSFGKPTPTPTGTLDTKPKVHSVTIESPLAEALEQSEKVLVSGATSPSSRVFIAGALDEGIVQANDEGKYAGKITLEEGKNDIVVTSINTTGTIQTQTVRVYYTPEEW